MAILKKMSGYDEDAEDEKQSGGAPAILPKSILMGKKAEVGDKIILKIDRITEDGLAVSYAAEKPPEEEEPAGEEMEEGGGGEMPPAPAGKPAELGGYD